mmetsp:Transcript_9235/g.11066  ORF Transcript_9235/g.11066 Transcript_9235/m.11066 type:complete len:302 (-) Transcript_9235:117-1022(-)|eukprot:CAMPEP_0195268072 /NCGR_PEP_ID=MMETSP0706-20130129/12958_1 /TAXON_ID=33640 /ORGANISM="Asterionellopsis glacialis, Strain CCMP134" /LENGTH=301 /DNA_ID=CAMNT_0040322925 /DNA_START=23 /DNA_END=928 /DNA_ORIENTATION=+
MARFLQFAVAFYLVASTAASSRSAWSLPLVRGGEIADYAGQLEGVKAVCLEKAGGAMEELKRAIIDEGSVVAGFGAKADTICNQALEEFAQNAPDAGDDSSAAAAYDRKLEELEAAIDAPLQVLYLRQLAILREQALQKYRASSRTSGSSEYEAMLQADGQFARDAEEATRDGGGEDWEYASERSYLQAVMNNIAESGKKAVDIQMKSAQQQQTAMQFLQSQQQMIQQLQMQLYGQTSPWNVGVAYRIPDTNFNLQGSYQQGRANVQLSCVPDEYAPMLGPNGFTNGVGPGNLGLSLNLSV